ncbi:MAG: hypothetical protein EA417_03610 [Gammaproteobacteria bacterium]|nr:MAG: hypothetical protein EA417_03610 [Gammaproteobacteria bacterium]
MCAAVAVGIQRRPAPAAQHGHRTPRAAGTQDHRDRDPRRYARPARGGGWSGGRSCGSGRCPGAAPGNAGRLLVFRARPAVSPTSACSRPWPSLALPWIGWVGPAWGHHGREYRARPAGGHHAGQAGPGAHRGGRHVPPPD